MKFGPFEVLDRVNTDRSASPLAFEIIITIANCKKIFVSGVPADTSNIFPLCLLGVNPAKEADVCLRFIDVVP